LSPKRSAVEAGLIFLAFFLPGYVAQASVPAAGPVTNLVMLQSIIVGVPQCLLMAWIAGATGPFSAPLWGLSPLAARDVLRILLAAAACFAVALPFSLLVSALPASWLRTVSFGYRWSLERPGQIPLAILFSLTAGYREEFFFRAYLLRRLEEVALARAAAVTLSTALFCVGHVYEGVLGVALAAALGLVLAGAYILRRNVHVIAIAHGLFNAAVLSLSLFAPRALSGTA
jgi:membrane protease YdiL (CAAX protease family)